MPGSGLIQGPEREVSQACVRTQAEKPSQTVVPRHKEQRHGDSEHVLTFTGVPGAELLLVFRPDPHLCDKGDVNVCKPRCSVLSHLPLPVQHTSLCLVQSLEESTDDQGKTESWRREAAEGPRVQQCHTSLSLGSWAGSTSGPWEPSPGRGILPGQAVAQTTSLAHDHGLDADHT